MKNFLRTFSVAGLSLVVLASCTPKETRVLLEPSQALGTVLAEETVRASGPGKPAVLILPQWKEASTVEESFRAAFKKLGGAAVTAKVADIGDPMRRGQIGLKAVDFFAALDQAGSAGSVVSLAGAPLLQAGDVARLGTNHPPVLVAASGSLGNVPGVAGNPPQLAALLEAGVIQSAIIDGGEPPVSTSQKTDPTHELFAQNYRLLRRPN